MHQNVVYRRVGFSRNRMHNKPRLWGVTAMQRTILGALALAAAFPFALDARERDNDYRRYGYNDPVSRTIRDLEGIGSRSFVDRHEQKHFRRALEELYRFRYRAQDGRFDKDRLDKAIEHIDHLAGADQLHPRARQILRGNLWELRRFRSELPYARHRRW